ncbi:MAG: biopolymer transporter ExbD [Bryobacteraceae bacterium]
MGMSIGSAHSVRADINMTPMIDVMLVLIIIFMVITPLASLGLDTLVPQSSAAGRPMAEASQDLVITALADGSYLLNREPLAHAAMESRLMTLLRNGAADVVFVRGARDIEFRRIAETVDLARGIGVPRIGLIP